MSNLIQGFKALLNVIKFNNLPLQEKTICFYCEGSSYWPHLKGLLEAIVEYTDFKVCFITSSLQDEGLKFFHPRVKRFFVGFGFVRNYFFQNLNTKILVLTMPDLNQYQIKRSKYPVHYAYVQHSLVSLHMVYRKGAFDHYDSIFCAGPHHVAEINAIIKLHKLPPKHIVKLGYSLLDQILSTKKANASTKQIAKNSKGHKLTILIAPSWGEHGLIESGLANEVISDLLNSNYKVILRPHPQTTRLSRTMIDRISELHSTNSCFAIDNEVSGQTSLHNSDVMISDWSGVALEFAFGFNKPVIFCDTKRKINNPDYEQLDLVPFEVKVRDEIGIIWQIETSIASAIDQVQKLTRQNFKYCAKQNVFNLQKSDKTFAKEIKKLLMPS